MCDGNLTASSRAFAITDHWMGLDGHRSSRLIDTFNFCGQRFARLFPIPCFFNARPPMFRQFAINIALSVGLSGVCAVPRTQCQANFRSQTGSPCQAGAELQGLCQPGGPAYSTAPRRCSFSRNA
jgi:hypothetical protein